MLMNKLTVVELPKSILEFFRNLEKKGISNEKLISALTATSSTDLLAGKT